MISRNCSNFATLWGLVSAKGSRYAKTNIWRPVWTNVNFANLTNIFTIMWPMFMSNLKRLMNNITLQLFLCH